MVTPSSLVAVVRMMPHGNDSQFTSLRSWCSWEFGISGTAKFIENSDATLSIELNYKILLKEVLIQHTYTLTLLREAQ
jgi:hypothetical protein